MYCICEFVSPLSSTNHVIDIPHLSDVISILLKETYAKEIMVKWMLCIYNNDILCLLDRCLSNGWPWNVFITGSLLIRVTSGVTVSFKF